MPYDPRVPQGLLSLLDRSNAPAGLLGPTAGPGAAAGLLTPVIWDRLQRGINPMMTTEGARPSYGGGGSFYAGGTEGRLTDQYPLDLRGGRGAKPPPPSVSWKPEWTSAHGGQHMSTTTPSGTRVIITGGEDGEDGAPVTAEVMFYEPSRIGQSGISGTQAQPGGSTARSINRFSEVYTAVKDYLKNYGADRLTFSAASDSHMKLYDRVAPLMAKQLGGILHVPGPGQYEIDGLGR
jgi:hypothetical protein